MAEVSPSTSAGTSARGSAGRPATAERNPSRTRSTSSSDGPGGARTSAPCRSRRTAATSDPRSTVSSRPETRTVLPTSTRRQESTAGSPPMISSTGARTAQACPRPVTVSSRTRTVA